MSKPKKLAVVKAKKPSPIAPKMPKTPMVGQVPTKPKGKKLPPWLQK